MHILTFPGGSEAGCDHKVIHVYLHVYILAIPGGSEVGRDYEVLSLSLSLSLYIYIVCNIVHPYMYM